MTAKCRTRRHHPGRRLIAASQRPESSRSQSAIEARTAVDGWALALGGGYRDHQRERSVGSPSPSPNRCRGPSTPSMVARCTVELNTGAQPRQFLHVKKVFRKGAPATRRGAARARHQRHVAGLADRSETRETARSQRRPARGRRRCGRCGYLDRLAPPLRPAIFTRTSAAWNSSGRAFSGSTSPPAIPMVHGKVPSSHGGRAARRGARPRAWRRPRRRWRRVPVL